LKYLQESKIAYVALAILGASLCVAPIAFASNLGVGNNFLYSSTGGNTINAVNGNKLTFFVSDLSLTFGSANFSRINYLGTGGNDTFVIWAGNSTVTGVATGVGNDTFFIWSGNDPGTAAGHGTNSTFSLQTGSFGCFDIVDNGNGTLHYAITAGVNSTINEGTNAATFTAVCPQNAAIPAPYTVPLGTPIGVGGWGDITYSINVGDNSSISFGNTFYGNNTINVVF